MKKLLYISTFIIAAFSLNGQVSNQTVQSCDNDARSIYDVLGTGRSLMVASQGLDCGICQSRAMSLEQWASQNTAEVEVWGAMTNTFSGVTPQCRELDSWDLDYSWNTVFSFIDANQIWFDQGTPRYYVYDPADSSLAYNGFSLETAENISLSLSQNSIGLDDLKNIELEVFLKDNSIVINNLIEGVYDYSLVSLTGKVVKSNSIEIGQNPAQIETIDMRNGIYLLNLKNNNGFQSVKRIFIK